MSKKLRTVAVSWLLFAWCWSWSAPAAAQPVVIAAEDFELQLAPDLRLSLDREFLHVQSGAVQALLTPPYGSSRKGWADAIQQATVKPGGDVVIQYRSECHASHLTQTTSLSALRAKLLMSRAELAPPAEAQKLVEQANALSPRDPAAAVARAALYGAEPALAAMLLAPALASARLETYFEVLRQAPQLLSLPLMQKQRARALGNARLSFETQLFAVSGSLVALSEGAATEADCSSAIDLLLLDTKTGAVVFRHPYVLYDAECRALPVHVTPLNHLLSELGFNQAGEMSLAESTDYQKYEFSFVQAGIQVRIDRARHSLAVQLGQRRTRSHWASTEQPQRAQWLPELRTIVVQTNRDSDVCEGLPSFELIRVPPGP